MRFCRTIPIMALVLATAAVLSACGQSSPSTLSSTPVPTAPASPTVPKVVASPTATGGLSPADLVAKARTSEEFSCELKVTSPGQTASGKMYIKGTKLREDATFNGQNIVVIVDTVAKVAYMLVAGQNTAVRLDASQIVSKAPSPTEQVSALPADAKFVGNDTIDGMTAAVYEATIPGGTTKYSIWTERGLPLRIEATTAQGTATIEFSNYQFAPQADSLFQLPPGTQVIDALSAVQDALGEVPTAKP